MGSETAHTSRLWSCIHLTTLLAVLFSPVKASAQVTQTVGPNVNISQLSGNQEEVAIAINPTNPQQLFASSVFARGVLFAARSTDGGQTWQPSNGSDFFIADGGDNLTVACCDPTVAWDDFGNLFIAYLDNNSASKVPVALSTDGGATFTPLATLGGGTDQPTIVTGPGSGANGSVWVTYRELGGLGRGLVAQGASVTGLGSVGAFSTPQVAPGTFVDGSFGDIAIGPAGQVLVTHQIPTGGEGPATIYVNLDADGLGAGGFGSQIPATMTNVGGFDFIPPQSFRSVDAEAGLAYDRSGGGNDGRVYLVYTDETPDESNNTDIFVRFSDDNGATWSAPVRVNDDATTNSQFLPRIALDQTTGALAVSWHDSRNDGGQGAPGDTDNTPNTDAQLFATVSVDGGGTFLPNVQVSAGTSNARSASSVIDYGDYTGLAFFGGSFYPAWADNSNSTGDNPNGTLTRFDIYTAQVVLTGIDKAITSGPDADGDSEIDLVVPVGQTSTTQYDFTITYTNPGGPAVLIVDTVPAEWIVTKIAGTLVNVDECGASDNVSGPFGAVHVFKAGKPGKKCQSATQIEWTPPFDGGSIKVVATTRQSPGKKNDRFAPTACKAFFLNYGAQVLELVGGEPQLPPLFTSNPLILAAVADVNGDGQIVRDGTGDEDGDGLTDLAEVSGEIVTNPCNPDTDGDGVNDGQDQCPLQGETGSVDANGCPLTP